MRSVAPLALILALGLGSCGGSAEPQAADTPASADADSAQVGKNAGPQKPEGSKPTIGAFEGPVEEYMPAVVTCLQEAGWDAIYRPEDDSISVPSVTFEQRKAFSRARRNCDVELGVPEEEPPMTKDEIGEVYDYYTTTLTACIQDHGYPVNDPPSRDTYISGYYESAGWSPYNTVPEQLSEAEWLQLNVDCPQDIEDAR